MPWLIVVTIPLLTLYPTLLMGKWSSHLANTTVLSRWN